MNSKQKYEFLVEMIHLNSSDKIWFELLKDKSNRRYTLKYYHISKDDKSEVSYVIQYGTLAQIYDTMIIFLRYRNIIQDTMYNTYVINEA